MSKEAVNAVLITGGSHGIGRSLAEVFAHHGYNLILVSRIEDKLIEARDELLGKYHIQCSIVPMDLSRQESAEKLYDLIHEQGWIVEILVNNAGCGTWGNYAEIDPTRSLQEMNLNMVSLSLLTNFFLKDMVKKGSGRIMNIASTAAFQPGPMMAVYYATKAYVFSFSEAISKEIRGTGVTITVVCPGPTQTGFQGHAGMAKMHLLKSVFLMDSMDVAQEAYLATMKGKRIIIPGLLNKIVAFGVKFLPKWFVLSLVLGLHKKRA